MLPYTDFIARRRPVAHYHGIAAATSDLNPILFPFQRAIVRWALELGRAAIFAERGLGKTFMQLEWARHVAAETRGRVLILCPLAVAAQTVAEGQVLGVPITYVRSQAEADTAHTRIVITNYDLILRDAFDLSAFAGVVLDESSILKTFTGATKRALIRGCASTPFRLCCTATPSPNDTVELGNHSEFLGVMSSSDMLTKFFIRDSNTANSLRLRGHAVGPFWRWVTSWAVCVGKPSDLDPSFDDTGYELPPLTIVDQIVPVDHTRAWQQTDKRGARRLFLDGTPSATAMWAEKRATLDARVQRVAEIVAGQPDDPWICWHSTDKERDALGRLIPEASIVTGSQSPAVKEQLLTAFSEGRSRIMATKPEIGGWGLNWQHCADMVFTSVTHKFEEWYQALGRCHRFGQTRRVRAHLVYAESEGSIVETLRAKWVQHEAMRREMIAAMQQHGLGRVDRTSATDQRLHQVTIPTWMQG